MTVSIVCVNYNSYPQLKNYLFSLKKAKENCDNLDLKVFIADNSTEKEDFSFSMPFELYNIPLDNLGYFGGAFYVINKYEDIHSADYVIISNVDLQVAEDFFTNLQHVKTDNGTMWICPQIYSTIDDAPKNYRLKFTRPTKRRIILLMISFRFSIIQKIYRKTVFKKKKLDRQKIPQKFVYSGHGSFFILTRKFFDSCMSKDLFYEPFLYGEEYFIAEMIRKHNGKVEYIPELVIYDDEHVSTGKLPGHQFFEYNYNALKFLYKSFFKS